QLIPGIRNDPAFGCMDVRSGRNGERDAVAVAAIGLLAEPGDDPPLYGPTELADAVGLLLGARLAVIGWRFVGGNGRHCRDGARIVCRFAILELRDLGSG